MASSSTKLTMKLLIDSKREKVLFAEASKEVIDFLFNLLCLPLGTVIRLLSKNDMVGCLGNLYQSVEDMSETYMQSDVKKDVLLNPRASISSNLLLTNDGSTNDNSDVSLYRCSYCTEEVTFDKETRCPKCNRFMNKEVRYVGSNKAAKDLFPSKSGFVKEVVTYMVMDDLVIQPMSTISSITLLNKFNIKEIGSLQEKVVEFGMNEGVNLLKASLQSKMVLTTVFLIEKNTE